MMLGDEFKKRFSNEAALAALTTIATKCAEAAAEALEGKWLDKPAAERWQECPRRITLFDLFDPSYVQKQVDLLTPLVRMVFDHRPCHHFNHCLPRTIMAMQSGVEVDGVFMVASIEDVETVGVEDARGLLCVSWKVDGPGPSYSRNKRTP